MMTPFASEAAKEHISELVECFMCPLEYINKFEFEIVVKEATEKDIANMRKTMKKFSALSDEEIEEAIHDNGVDSDIGYEIWAGACLLDDVLNGTDYSADCIGYSDEYRKVTEMLMQDISKKKFLSKKPFYNLPEILQNAIDALDYVLGINCDSKLAEEMCEKGIFKEWENEIIDLQNRLSSHIE